MLDQRKYALKALLMSVFVSAAGSRVSHIVAQLEWHWGSVVHAAVAP